MSKAKKRRKLSEARQAKLDRIHLRDCFTSQRPWEWCQRCAEIRAKMPPGPVDDGKAFLRSGR